MRFYSTEKTALLIDAHSTWAAADQLDLVIDWGKLELFFGRQTTLVSSMFFTRRAQEKADGFEPLRRLLDWLDTNDWVVVERDGLIGVDLAVAAMEMAAGVSRFVIASGNPEFVALAEALQRRGCRVTILSTVQGRVCADELRRAANDFLDFNSMRAEIVRAPRKEAVSA